MSDMAFKLTATLVSINFAIFWLIDVIYGGDAISGKVVDNHYYIGAHGKYREVSHSFFVYSALHTCVSMGGILAVVLVSLHRRKRKSN